MGSSSSGICILICSDDCSVIKCLKAEEGSILQLELLGNNYVESWGA